jgi:hypothetical protein
MLLGGDVMSAQVFPLSSAEEKSDKALSVSFRVIAALYAIIPVCLVLQGADWLYWDGLIRRTLPSSPSHFLLFQILFGTPHILGSTMILAGNREYLQFYRRKIMLMSVAIAVFFALGSQYFSYRTLYVAVAAWTVYHVLKQQYGIGRAVCRLPAWAFHLTLWLSVAAGLMIYLGIFLKNSLNLEHAEWLRQCSASLCTLLLLSALYIHRYVAPGLGKLFFWANILLVLSSFYLYLREYYFLAILVPRLIHDATAYIVYVTHDYNRHGRKPQNALYRFARQWHIPVIAVLPVISFALALLLQNYGDLWVNWLVQTLFGVEIRKAVTIGVLGYLALMHYYTEAFIWKGASPCRRYIGFTR